MADRALLPERKFLTEKEWRILGALESGPRRYTDLRQTGVYGNKGLADALSRFLAAGLVRRDERRCTYQLTVDGGKQVYMWWVFMALDSYSRTVAYREFKETAELLWSIILERRAGPRKPLVPIPKRARRKCPRKTKSWKTIVRTTGKRAGARKSLTYTDGQTST